MTVVIPTRNRPSQLVTAVNSALQQTLRPLEVVVVIDGPDADSLAALDLYGDAVRVLQHSHSRGAGAARRTGIEAARGTLIAFLDDDDEWVSTKLERQVAVFEAADDAHNLIVGCQCVFDDGTDQPRVWPTRSPYPGERVGHYLFVRNRPGEGMLPTPSLVVPRQLASEQPFPEHLRTHEEWDWLLSLDARGARVEVVPEPLVHVDARPRRASVSSADHWKASTA